MPRPRLLNTLHLHVPIDLDAFAEQATEHMSHDELHKLIIAIDLEVADAGFTERLMVELMKSMRAEFKNYPEELASFLNALGVKDAK